MNLFSIFPDILDGKNIEGATKYLQEAIPQAIADERFEDLSHFLRILDVYSKIIPSEIIRTVLTLTRIAQDKILNWQDVRHSMVTNITLITHPDSFYESLSPGIRKLVRKLNEWGFDTTDSGDGTNYKEGMGCAVPYPMVVILLDREKKDPFEETDRLTKLLTEAGVEIGTERVPEYLRWVQLTYTSLDGNCIVTVDNVLDSDLT